MQQDVGYYVHTHCQRGHCLADSADHFQVQGKWRHCSGGVIDVMLAPSGDSVLIYHPQTSMQTIKISEFLQPSYIYFLGFRGWLEGDNITWNNGVVWTKIR